MIRITRLQANNFGSLEGVDLNLASRGLVLVTGDNQDNPQADSNGAGKSLLLDSLTWCIWGSTVRGIAHDDVVSNRAGADCIVTVTLQENDDEYQIVRVRKNKTALPGAKANDLLIRKNGQELKLPNVADTQRVITNLLGMSFLVFRAMMPGAGLRVAEMTDKEAKELLEELLQADVFADAQAVASRRLREASLRGQELTKDLVRLEGAMESLEAQLVTARGMCASFEETKGAKLIYLKEELSKWETECGRRSTALAPFVDFHKEDLIRLQGQSSSIERSIFKSLSDARADLAGKAATEQANLAQLRKDLASYKAINVQAGFCPSCYQEVGSDHVEATNEFVAGKVNELEVLIKASASQAEGLNKQLAGIPKDLAGAGSFAPTSQLVVSLRDTQEDAQTLHKNLQSKDQLTKLVSEADAQVKAFNIAIQEEALKVNPYDGMISASEENIAEAQRKIALVKSSLDKNKEEVSTLEFWASSFSPQGIRNFTLDRVLPILNESASRHASAVSSDLTVVFSTKEQLKAKVRDSFHVQVSYRNGSSSYEGCSAGEKARANLVIAQAIGDLASMRSSKTINLRFLDEPFESIDESGIDAIMSLLRSLEGSFETVLLISHLESIKQMVGSSITVTKKGGVSRCA